MWCCRLRGSPFRIGKPKEVLGFWSIISSVAARCIVDRNGLIMPKFRRLGEPIICLRRSRALGTWCLLWGFLLGVVSLTRVIWFRRRFFRFRFRCVVIGQGCKSVRGVASNDNALRFNGVILKTPEGRPRKTPRKKKGISPNWLQMIFGKYR